MAPNDSRAQRRLGTRVRALRQKEGLTQVEFARRLGISASYLNLIEHNQRSLTAPLLLKIAEELHVDLQDFSDGRDDDLAVALVEVLSDPMFTEHGVAPGQVHKQLQDLVGASPAIAALRFDEVSPIGRPVAGSPLTSRNSRWPCAWPVSPSAVERKTAATSL